MDHFFASNDLHGRRLRVNYAVDRARGGGLEVQVVMEVVTTMEEEITPVVSVADILVKRAGNHGGGKTGGFNSRNYGVGDVESVQDENTGFCNFPDGNSFDNGNTGSFSSDGFNVSAGGGSIDGWIFMDTVGLPPEVVMSYTLTRILSKKA
ncbi:hypothetical protein Pint_29679 [Pistacia integerrima]|uniref:Uncharacterized protein n=1 Tax=Pistacia integerrima TaxID=434235 RepID=A0ACC0X158_9ROSI|nr:hypothetical protein Pint_29679 [Pistacia integerrima]